MGIDVQKLVSLRSRIVLTFYIFFWPLLSPIRGVVALLVPVPVPVARMVGVVSQTQFEHSAWTSSTINLGEQSELQ